jgi:hypothetical protein
MSEAIPAVLRAAVFRRAGGRCEYCGLAQAGQEAAFHIDHVTPLAGGILTSDDARTSGQRVAFTKIGSLRAISRCKVVMGTGAITHDDDDPGIG